jgi:hypothetical protein
VSNFFLKINNNNNNNDNNLNVVAFWHLGGKWLTFLAK